MSKCIATIEQMVQVLNNGAKEALDRAHQLGKPGIPCSVNLFKLKVPKARAPFVFVKNIKSIQCITYITKPENRRDPTDTGYYINVFPWISWRRGWAIPIKDICDGNKARVLTAKQRKLKKTHKPAGERKQSGKQLTSFHKNRVAILEKLEINVNSALKPVF